MTAITEITPIVSALFLIIVVERLMQGLIAPIFEKFSLDKFYLMYISWVVGGALVYISGINLFTPYIADPLIGQILSALAAGGGSNLLHDIFDNK